MGQPYGDSHVKDKCASRWEACGWISQAAPTILPFPPAEKMWDPDFCAILTSFSSEEEMLRDLKKKKHCLFCWRGFVCFSLCHRYSGDGYGTSAMAPFVFPCTSKQLAMLIKELFQIK